MKIILSIDGGGIRGIIPATVLSYLEKKIQEISDNRLRLGNLVDFVAGTSTGSIIGTLMLVPGETGLYPKYEMDEILNMYFDLGDKVFKKNIWHNIKTVWGIFGPRFPASNIDESLFEELGHIKLQDLFKPCLFTGYDIDKRRVMMYTNRDKANKYGHLYARDIVRGSTAIPSYFPPAYFQDGVNYHTIVDGGVFANNPALAAYIEVSKTIFECDDCRKYYPHELIVISLGTGGDNQKSYRYKRTKRWGKAEWILPVIDILLSSHAEVTDYEMRKIFAAYDSDHNYKRLNPSLKYGSSNPADASKENLLNLKKDALNYIEENKEYLNTLAREICDIKFLLMKNEDDDL